MANLNDQSFHENELNHLNPNNMVEWPAGLSFSNALAQPYSRDYPTNLTPQNLWPEVHKAPRPDIRDKDENITIPNQSSLEPLSRATESSIYLDPTMKIGLFRE
ncbi:hypothetical protein Dimus_006326 [Dionaea muscipula]